jgi:hypothetical protein
MKRSVFFAIAWLVISAAAAPAWGAQGQPTTSTEIPSETLNGTWEGELSPVDYRNTGIADLSKLAPARLQMIIKGSRARVQIKSNDGKLEEVKPGEFRVARRISNAAVIAIDSGEDDDGTWVETWLFAITAKDNDTLLVQLVRQVNNINLPVTVDYSKFACTWAGELKRK